MVKPAEVRAKLVDPAPLSPPPAPPPPAVLADPVVTVGSYTMYFPVPRVAVMPVTSNLYSKYTAFEEAVIPAAIRLAVLGLTHLMITFLVPPIVGLMTPLVAALQSPTL